MGGGGEEDGASFSKPFRLHILQPKQVAQNILPLLRMCVQASSERITTLSPPLPSFLWGLSGYGDSFAGKSGKPQGGFVMNWKEAL